MARPLSQLSESTDTFARSTTGLCSASHKFVDTHTPVARCGLATGSSSSLVKGFPIYQRARARGRYPSEEGIGYPTGHRTNRRTLGARVMTLTLGGWSEGQALHTSSDVMGRYRFPRTRLSRWLGPTNTPSSTRRLESNSQFFHGKSRTHDLAIMRSTLYPTELLQAPM